MKQKTRTKALSWLFSFAMVLSLLPGLSSTAKAIAPEDATWSENQNITADAHIAKLTVTANVTVTIAEGKTVTVYSGVDATDHTLTVKGPGTLIINGAKGNDGVDDERSPTYGEAGGNGFEGNIIVDGATVIVTGGTGGRGGGSSTYGVNGGSGGNGVKGDVTVKSGSIKVTGGTGGNGGGGEDEGGSGGNGGVGVNGTVTVTGGSATLTGGIGGEAGSGYDSGAAGQKDKAVSGTITGLGEESDDGTAWTAVSGNTSDKRYVKVEAAASAVTPTVTISPAGAGTVTAANHPNLSNSWQLTATPATGYAFKEWTYTTPGGQQKDSNNQLSVNKSYYNNGTISGLTAVFEEGSGATDDTSTYTLTIPSTLTVANSGWNATAGISATGTLASGKKLTVTASSGDEFALVNQSDSTQKVGYKLATASTDTEATTSWEFTELSSTATKKDMGIIVDDYSTKPAGTYQDTVTFTAKVESAGNIVTLSTLTGDNYTAQSGDILTGTLVENVKISIADGATVTLKDVNIPNLEQDCYCAGINCSGDATLILEGTNTVCASSGEDSNHYPGIWIAKDKTLTIAGDGSLNASCTAESFGAGIGGGSYVDCGNIVINGGTITATGGKFSAGIGSGWEGACGNITIKNTVTKVTATAGSESPNSIGAGKDATCGTVTIGGVEGAISVSPYTYEPQQ